MSWDRAGRLSPSLFIEQQFLVGRPHGIRAFSQDLEVSHSSLFLARPVPWPPHLEAWYLMIFKSLSAKGMGSSNSKNYSR